MGEFFICSIFFGAFLLFFPIYVYTDGYLDLKENKCYFAISLYRFLKVIGGYIQAKKDGLVFHLGKKKAIFLPYKDMKGAGKKFEITKGFQLWRFHQVIETGGAGEVYGVLIAAAVQATGNLIFSVLQSLHPFLSLKNDALLSEGNTLKITLQTAVVFNGLVLMIAITKKLLEGMINWIKEKKLTASWKRRRSSLPTS